MQALKQSVAYSTCVQSSAVSHGVINFSTASSCCSPFSRSVSARHRRTHELAFRTRRTDERAVRTLLCNGVAAAPAVEVRSAGGNVVRSRMSHRRAVRAKIRRVGLTPCVPLLLAPLLLAPLLLALLLAPPLLVVVPSGTGSVLPPHATTEAMIERLRRESEPRERDELREGKTAHLMIEALTGTLSTQRGKGWSVAGESACSPVSCSPDRWRYSPA